MARRVRHTPRRRPARAESLLTVGRLFGAKEFDTEPLPARRWSKRSSTYFTLEKPTGGTGQELVRNDPATGKKEVVLPATAFVPKVPKKPLAVEAYEFSADESRVLIYTNSQTGVAAEHTRRLLGARRGDAEAPETRRRRRPVVADVRHAVAGRHAGRLRPREQPVRSGPAEPEDHPADHRRLEDAHQRHVRLGERRGTGPAELLPLESGRPTPALLAVRHHRRGGVSPRRQRRQQVAADHVVRLPEGGREELGHPAGCDPGGRREGAMARPPRRPARALPAPRRLDPGRLANPGSAVQPAPDGTPGVAGRSDHGQGEGRVHREGRRLVGERKPLAVARRRQELPLAQRAVGVATRLPCSRRRLAAETDHERRVRRDRRRGGG